MKNVTMIKVLASIIAIGLAVQACNNNKDAGDDAVPEFVATNSTFANFRSWSQVATHQGPDPALGGAHQGNDESVTRTIYIKDNQSRRADGQFPVGTVVVKDTKKDGNTIEVTAMVKRGSNFNPDNNDWEWFMLTPDGNIAKDNNSADLRGAMLMSGMCGACHTQAKNKDFLFSK